jgi:hypothetical protein
MSRGLALALAWLSVAGFLSAPAWLHLGDSVDTSHGAHVERVR